ncbi:PilN domain-containing protein [Calidifontibacillus oryziterrae]|uniref:PilN domain-containing protein n=1 Tax=Calidifontibacillus oryziterrae TaxID=1191699 RepID=UPI00030E1731|nr:PilN domain-containing protein [Calidifontibacillus oryziterrae]
MTIEINLLGKPEKRNMAPYIILAVILLFMLGLSIYGLLVSQEITSETRALEQKLQTTRQLIEIQGQKENEVKQTTAVDDLQMTIEWAETFPTPTVYLIRHLTSLLPERGFLMDFSYSDTGSIDLTVQADTSREIAYYLKSLLDSPYLSSAILNSITTAEVELEQFEIVDGELIETKVEGDYVPRYKGQFQLTVNRDALKADAAKEGNGR